MRRYLKLGGEAVLDLLLDDGEGVTGTGEEVSVDELADVAGDVAVGGGLALELLFDCGEIATS